MQMMESLSYLVEGTRANETSETVGLILFNVTLMHDTGLSFPRLDCLWL